jgi:hypothetical protein
MTASLLDMCKQHPISSKMVLAHRNGWVHKWALPLDGKGNKASRTSACGPDRLQAT